jgi:hypothetical protein
MITRIIQFPIVEYKENDHKNHTISNCWLHAYTSAYYSRHFLHGTQIAARQGHNSRYSTPLGDPYSSTPCCPPGHSTASGRGLHAFR